LPKTWPPCRADAGGGDDQADQLTRSATPDAVGSIRVDVLLAAVAIHLFDRNRRFLVGEEMDLRVRAAVIRALLQEPEVARVTYLSWRSSARQWSRSSAT
jgi:hypothetical protein